MVISSLFEKPVDRSIEGVIKADDESGLRTEFEEYVLTNEVAKRLEKFLYAYNNPETANGVWISGFFGSGKSHLLKMLAYVLEDRAIDGSSALALFAPKCAGNDILLADLQRAASIPSRSILFNIDQKADVISKREFDAVLAVFARVFNEARGYYGKQGYIARFERDLDANGLYQPFKEAFKRQADMTWEDGREIAVLKGPEVAAAYAEIAGNGQDAPTDILEKYRNEYTLSIEEFAEEVRAYIDTQGPAFRLNFFVDEVGQYVADNVKLMTNLQTIAESLATRCRGRAWLIVTAQEEMGSVLGNMSKSAGNDFSKIQDRFNIRLKLTSTDVAEVIQRRLLAKQPDAIELLSDMYNAQHNNFETLFSFADGTKTYRHFRDRDDFVHSYPFIPYQFELFQAAIINLSIHNAFEGRHSSVGERSMLGVFQQVAIAIGNDQVGRLATFDRMFEGIRAALKSGFQQSISQAEKSLNDDFAVRLLKTLFLVKYIKEFQATARNLAVLMIDGFETDLSALHRRVEQALDKLEREVYILRRGNVYEYLTDEEKDIEQEILNTPVEQAEVENQLAEIIFDTILKGTRLRLQDSDQDYFFSRKIDERLLGKDHELTIHVITPFHEHSDNLPTLRAHSLGRNELLVVLPPNERLMRDLMLYKRTETYARQNMRTTQKESARRILLSKQEQNRDRADDLRRQTEEVLAQATLVVDGGDVDAGTSDARTRLLRGAQHLVTRTYPHRAMLRGVTYKDEDIERFLHPPNTLLGDAEATFSEAEQEMLTYIQGNKASGKRTAMQSLENHFERKPYGWPLVAIQCILAKLLGRGKVEARRDSNILENDELAQALRNTRGYANLLLEPQVEFTGSQIRRLKAFHNDFFDSPPHATEAKALGQETAAAFDREVERLKLLQQQTAAYPFAQTVAEAVATVAAAAHQPYTFYLLDLSDQADDLLALKEEVLDPVRAFIGSSQQTIYDDARRLLRDQQANFAYIEGDDVATLAALLDDPAPYRGQKMPRIKELADALGAQCDDLIVAEREAALAETDAAWQELLNDPRYAALAGQQQDDLAGRFEQTRAAVNHHVLVDAIRGARYTFRDRTWPEIRHQLREWSRPVVREGDNDNEPAPPQTVRAADLTIDYAGKTVETTNDVARYADAVKRAFQAALDDNKRIEL